MEQVIHPYDIRRRLLRKISFISRRVRDAVRFKVMNSQPGITVSTMAYVSPTVRIPTLPDGCFYGGRVEIACWARISQNAVIAPFDGFIELEESVYIGPSCMLYGNGGIKIGKNTLIGPQTLIIASNHNFEDTSVPIGSQGCTVLGIEIEEDVWIGAGCKVLDGVTIGKGCVIGAGSVVTKSIPPYSIAVGVPARVIKSRLAAQPLAAKTSEAALADVALVSAL